MGAEQAVQEPGPDLETDVVARADAAPSGIRSVHGPTLDRYVTRQVVAGLVFSLTHACVGAETGLMSVFRTQETGGYLTQAEITWVISSRFIGQIAGHLVSMVLTSILGYRRLIQVAAPFGIASWLVLSLCHRFPVMIVSRILIGLTIGATNGAARAYISEISAEWLRGALGFIPQLMVAINMIIVYGISSQASWRYATLACGVTPAIMQLVGTFWLPDSAKWMVTHGKSPAEAKKSIIFFRGCPATASAEVSAIQHAQLSSVAASAGLPTRVAAVVLRATNRRPLLLLLCQVFFIAFCAGESSGLYTTEIFAAANAGDDIYGNAMVSAAPRIVGCLLSGWLIERWGRIPLLLTASVCQMAGALTEACCFHLGSSATEHGWLVLLGVSLIHFSYTLAASATWVLLSELPCNSVRSESVNMLFIWYGILLFSFVHVSNALVEVAGFEGLYWVLGALCLLQMVFAWCCLPETRGLPLEEIQTRYFQPKKEKLICQKRPWSRTSAKATHAARCGEVKDFRPGTQISSM